MTVTVLLVSHDGARWLPAVMDGLEAQTRLPDQLVAVDTGSTDTSVELLRQRLGADAVVDAPARSSFGKAVKVGLNHVASTDWVWLLHDDSAPAPDALESLLAAADGNPSVSALGPKLREWPSLRRLLEIGVTISGTGRRETGLERGEYDQGQHDRTREVLAVNTAGMLVRRDVFEELGGFDDRLPLFGNDIDFGWRAARAGHRTLVVPAAVVFHVEAAHRGVRRTPVTSSNFRRAERRGALYTMLANCSLGALPFQVVRLFLGSLLRVLGLLLVRAPKEAYDEFAALVATYLRPDRVIAGRVRRRKTAVVSSKDIRHLLAPFWVPYRHGLDFVTEIATAVAHQAGDVSARRSGRVEAIETGPVPSEMQNLPADTGLMARLLTSPAVAVFAALTVLALVCARGAVGSGMLSGGALLPAPDSAAGWWDVYFASRHEPGVGSAAPYLLPLAMAATLLFGKAWLLVDLVFLLAVPLAALGAYRFLILVTGARLPALWGAVAYGLLPVLSGAVNQGRLGTVAALLILPWLATSALFLGSSHAAERRWRAGWRTGLWLALLSAFVPVAWLISLAVALAAVITRVAAKGPVATTVAVVPVLLLPWSILSFGGSGNATWFFEAGLPASSLLSPLGSWDLLLGRPAEVGSAPGWISGGVVLAAVAALLRRDTRSRVLHAWVVLVAALGTVALLAGLSQPPWLGFPLLLAQASAICAVAMAGRQISEQLSGSSFGWRQPVGALVVAVAVLSPVTGLLWWATTGILGPLEREAVDAVPTYMTDAAEADPKNGVLIVRGNRDTGLEYVVLRGDGPRIGDDSVAPSQGSQQPLTDLVGNLATTGQAKDIESLSKHGVEFIYAPPPADPVLAGNLDGVSGVTAASAAQPKARAWQLEADPSREALPDSSGSARQGLLALQLVALLVVAVLAAPSRRVRR